jgi:phosphoglycerate kinase
MVDPVPQLEDLRLDRGTRVLLRTDFNVPLHDGIIEDDLRITTSLRTIQYLRDRGARVVCCSHLGRPMGKVDMKYSLLPVARRLSEILGFEVPLSPEVAGFESIRRADSLRPGGVMLIENLRFDPGEEANDPAFAANLSELGDVYVDEAFGAAHRAHASVEAIAHLVPRPAAGLLMEQELRYLGHALESPERPFVLILGGAKVSDKIDVIQNMLGKVNRLLIGGAMAYTFFKARGVPIGRSLVEDDKLDAARRLELDAAARGVQLELPVDHVVTDRVEAGTANDVLAIGDARIAERYGVDIGPATIKAYEAALADAKTVVWNGPMGVFEIEAFAAGTNAVARAVAAVKGTTIIGGGDSISAVKKAGVADRITHISTGGGASLEFLGGCTLPGVAALADRE